MTSKWWLVVAAVLASGVAACGSGGPAAVKVGFPAVAPHGDLSGCVTGGSSPLPQSGATAGLIEYTDTLGRAFAVGYPKQGVFPQETPITLDATAPLNEASWSADGREMSFVHLDAHQQPHVTIGDLPSGHTSDLGTLDGNEVSPVLSGDGATIAVLDGPHRLDVRSRAGGHVRIGLAGGDADSQALSLSADGQVAAIGVLGGGVIVVRRSPPEQFVVGDQRWHVTDGVVSPNGRCVALLGAGDKSVLRLYVLDLSTRQARTVCDVAPTPRASGTASWSADGRELAMSVTEPLSTDKSGKLEVLDTMSGGCAQQAGSVSISAPVVIPGSQVVTGSFDKPPSLLVYAAGDGSSGQPPVAKIPIGERPWSIAYRSVTPPSPPPA